MRKACQHGVILPRGLKCDRGYLVLRIKQDGRWLFQGCGPHTPKLELAAKTKLEEIRLKQKLGTFNLPSKAARMTIDEAAKIFQQRQFVEYRDPDTNKPRSRISIVTNQSHLNAITAYMGQTYIDAITVPDLKRFRKKRLEYDGCAHGTVNRDLGVLSNLINCLKTWIQHKELDPIKLPVDETGHFINPCEFVRDLEEKRREIDYDYKDAITRLYRACNELKDYGMWSIIETELETTLRKNDLEKLEGVTVRDGIVSIEQGKTGSVIKLPELVKPNWAKVFVNFDSRWDRVRQAAGLPGMWFRDLRKIGMRMLEDLNYTPDEIAASAGHSSSAITKKWYLSGKGEANRMKPMLEARRHLIQSLKS